MTDENPTAAENAQALRFRVQQLETEKSQLHDALHACAQAGYLCVKAHTTHGFMARAGARNHAEKVMTEACLNGAQLLEDMARAAHTLAMDARRDAAKHDDEETH